LEKWRDYLEDKTDEQGVLLTGHGTRLTNLETLNLITFNTATIKLQGFASDLDVAVWYFLQDHPPIPSGPYALQHSRCVYLYVPAVTGTSTTDYLSFKGSTIPSAILPAVDDPVVVCSAIDQGFPKPVALSTSHVASTDWSFGKAGDFLGSGTKGLPNQLITYHKSWEVY
jgi:hypothetical protein